MTRRKKGHVCRCRVTNNVFTNHRSGQKVLTSQTHTNQTKKMIFAMQRKKRRKSFRKDSHHDHDNDHNDDDEQLQTIDLNTPESPTTPTKPIIETSSSLDRNTPTTTIMTTPTPSSESTSTAMQQCTLLPSSHIPMDQFRREMCVLSSVEVGGDDAGGKVKEADEVPKDPYHWVGCIFFIQGMVCYFTFYNFTHLTTIITILHTLQQYPSQYIITIG